jgi:hypothetical protein
MAHAGLVEPLMQGQTIKKNNNLKTAAIQQKFVKINYV